MGPTVFDDRFWMLGVGLIFQILILIPCLSAGRLVPCLPAGVRRTAEGSMFPVPCSLPVGRLVRYSITYSVAPRWGARILIAFHLPMSGPDGAHRI